MTTMHEALRYTRYGSADVERRLARTMANAAFLVRKHFSPDERRALLLIGGYGRGEGGVLLLNGEERPHNNIDFLLVASTTNALRTKTLKKRLDEILESIVREEQIGIDTGVMSELALRKAPRRIIFFDLRWGHRTLLGDASLVPSLPLFSSRHLEIDDVHNLLVNRASLLTINDAMIDRGFIADVHARFIIKHLMKAIIGHGDALLYTQGRYHPSYLEKQRRMRISPNIVSGFAELYDIATEFRFAPDYARYTGNTLGPFATHVRETLSRAHLEFERFRSGNAHCSFDGHAARVLDNRQESKFIDQYIKTLTAPWKPRSSLRPMPGLSPKLTRALHEAHPRARLAAALPAILYETTDEERQIVQSILGASANTPRALRNAYLHLWSQYGDPNFHTTAKRLGLISNTTEWPS